MGNPLGARKNGKFKAVSTAPSFNKTPMGNFTPPVPYPVHHDLSNSTGTASNVNFNGDSVYVLNQTTQSKCVGDNPGTAKGVKSGTVNGEIKPTSASSSVKVGKKPLVRQGDKCTLNSGNCPGVYITEPAPAAPSSAPKKIKSSSPDIHDVLDVLGFIPGLGAIPDLANAGIYAAQGNFAMAGLSVVAAVPGYGDVIKGGAMTLKGGKKLVKSAEKKAIKEAEEKALKKAGDKAASKGPGDGGRVEGKRKETKRKLGTPLTREEAKSFYKELGWSDAKIEAHLNGIDFRKPVTFEKITKGTELEQWVDPKRGTGNYFSYKGTSASELGICQENRVKESYIASKDMVTLKSTAASITDTWSVAGKSFPTTGGGTQFFVKSPELFTKL